MISERSYEMENLSPNTDYDVVLTLVSSHGKDDYDEHFTTGEWNYKNIIKGQIKKYLEICLFFQMPLRFIYSAYFILTDYFRFYWWSQCDDRLPNKELSNCKMDK